MALVTAGLLLPTSGIAQTAEELIPDSLNGFVLGQVDVRGPGAARATYERADGDEEMNLVLAHGDPARQLHDIIRSRLGSPEEESRRLEVDGRSFTSVVRGSEIVVFEFSDGILVSAGHEISDDEAGRRAVEASVAEFLEAFDPGRLAGWTPPEGSGAERSTERVTERIDETESIEEADGGGEPEDTGRRVERPTESPDEAGGEGTSDAAERPEETGYDANEPTRMCDDMECFRDAAARCEPARMTAAPGGNVTAAYRVEGPAEDGGCRISFTFTENPNPAFVDAPLYFTLDSESGVSGDPLRQAVEGCLSGDEDERADHDCEGPLIHVVEDGMGPGDR